MRISLFKDLAQRIQDKSLEITLLLLVDLRHALVIDQAHCRANMPVPSPTKTFHSEVYPSIDPTNPAVSVAGKTVLITGGGQGLGAAFAKAFSIAEAANIVLLGRKTATLEASKAAIEKLPINKAKVHVFEADVTNQSRVNAVFDQVASTIGKIDVYIVNAG